MNKAKVICLVGPTAIGKTDLSIKLCEKYHGEVINADASSFKKKLNIGTAKIDLNETTIPHHLIDIISPLEHYSIASYQKEARKLINEITLRDNVPFLVGGTGLYVNAVIYDYDLSSKGRISDDLYLDKTNEELHNLLKVLDYSSSLKIHQNNRKRVIRAIELAREGKALSENITSKDYYYDTLVICLDTSREVLYQRINKRVKQMFDLGLVDECLNLRKDNIDLSLITDIGYKETSLYLDNKLTKEEAIELIAKNTRHYAKRQLTWFRNKLDCEIINIDYNDMNKVFNDISIIIDKFLQK